MFSSELSNPILDSILNPILNPIFQILNFGYGHVYLNFGSFELIGEYSAHGMSHLNPCGSTEVALH